MARKWSSAPAGTAVPQGRGSAGDKAERPHFADTWAFPGDRRLKALVPICGYAKNKLLANGSLLVVTRHGHRHDAILQALQKDHLDARGLKPAPP